MNLGKFLIILIHLINLRNIQYLMSKKGQCAVLVIRHFVIGICLE